MNKYALIYSLRIYTLNRKIIWSSLTLTTWLRIKGECLLIRAIMSGWCVTLWAWQTRHPRHLQEREQASSRISAGGEYGTAWNTRTAAVFGVVPTLRQTHTRADRYFVFGWRFKLLWLVDRVWLAGWCGRVVYIAGSLHGKEGHPEFKPTPRQRRASRGRKLFESTPKTVKNKFGHQETDVKWMMILSTQGCVEECGTATSYSRGRHIFRSYGPLQLLWW